MATSLGKEKLWIQTSCISLQKVDLMLHLAEGFGKYILFLQPIMHRQPHIYNG